MKYHTNSSIQNIQREITYRCIELLELKDNGFVLDIGCGGGISGSVISEYNLPWVGCDISMDMLNICKTNNEAHDILRVDIGEGLHFLPGTFDYIISVSAIQWLFQSFKKEHDPKKRLRTFFTSLYSISKTNTRCVLQFYLKNKKHIELLKNEALRAGFHGGIQIDKPKTRHEKQYLVLDTSFSRRSKSNTKQRKGRK